MPKLLNAIASLVLAACNCMLILVYLAITAALIYLLVVLW